MTGIVIQPGIRLPSLQGSYDVSIGGSLVIPLNKRKPVVAGFLTGNHRNLYVGKPDIFPSLHSFRFLQIFGRDGYRSW